MTASLICAALTPAAIILGAVVGAATLKRERADRKHDSQPTPEETAPTQEELTPLPDYGDTDDFKNIGVSCGESEEYIWTECGPRLNVPPLDPPPSTQKDLYDAKCGAIKLTNPLGETGWQPTVGRIELWYTDVQHIRAIFDGANVPHDAVRHSCGSEEVAIERAKRMKKYLIEMHESRLRRKWEPVE